MKPILSLCVAAFAGLLTPTAHAGTLRAGGAIVDINPTHLPSPLGNGFGRRSITKINDPLCARAMVIDDGATSLAIVVVDSTLVSREIYDEAKAAASAVTGIPVSHMLMSATHNHSAPAASPIALNEPDEHYPKLLRERLAEAVIEAHRNLRPARIGWATAEEPNEINCRRWKLREGTIPPDPFGHTTDQVKMNPRGTDNLLEPAGPVDPQVSFVAAQSLDGKPIAFLAVYSLHYVGGIPDGAFSADYFGEFANQLQQRLGGGVAMLANGTSGDVNNNNFRHPRPRAEPMQRIREVAGVIAGHAERAYRTMTYHDDTKLGVLEHTLTLAHRLPSSDDVAHAREVLDAVGDRLPNNVPGVYARETLLMADPAFPKTAELKLQAIRIGDAAIATIPCEPFAQIGLNIRAASPFKPTFTIGLANGYNGYLPTPEQHKLGGYETWRCRWSCLEVDASTKIEAELGAMLRALR